MPHPNTPTAASPPHHHILGLVGWLVVSFIAAGVGAIASIDAQSFYTQLVQPEWAPPAWLFGPVWTVLYVVMAVAAWLVWRTHGWRGAAPALILFIMQLGANAMWTWLFFAWHLGGESMAEIVVLWLLIAANVLAFWRLHRIAGALLLPYLAWVSFASILTYAMWQLNPTVLG